MNKIGIYYAYWEKNWSADYLKYIDKVKKLGFDTLELAAGSLVEMTEYNLKQIAEYALVKNVNLTFCIGLPQKYDVASASTDIRNNGITFTKKVLNAIKIMDGNLIGGILYGSWPSSVYGIKEKMLARKNSLSSVKEIAKYAEDGGIMCCLEVVNRYEHFIINTVAEGIEYIQDIGSNNVKLLLDTFHMNIEEDSIPDAILVANNKLGHFHIGENNRKPPVKGKMAWGDIFKSLKKIAYKGNIVMEPFLKPGGEVGRDIKVYRDLSENASLVKMDAMAKESVHYLKTCLEQIYGQD